MNKLKEFFSNNKGIIVPTLVMFLICVVVTGALAGTNLITKENISKQETKQQNDSMNEVIPGAKYEKKTVKYKGEEYSYYIAEKSGSEVGYIYITSQKGYGGDDKVMTAIGIDGTILAVKVLDVSNETPGLGQNTGNPEWYAQFSGLDATTEIKLEKNSADKNNNEIKAVTGATISSKAIKEAVNKAIEINNYVLKEDV